MRATRQVSAGRRCSRFIAIVSGLSGSGKSTLARELSDRTGVATINSDVVRKMLAGKKGRQPAAYSQGIYSAAMTEENLRKDGSGGGAADPQRARGLSRSGPL